MKILYCENKIWNDMRPATVSLLVDSSLSRNFHPLFLPEHYEKWTMSIGLGVRIMRLGKYIAPRFVPRYYDAITLIARLRPQGVTPPASATMTAFDSSAVVGEWLPVTDELPSQLTIGERIATSVTFHSDRINNLISDLSQYFTLKTGDIIVAGDIADFTPEIDTSVRLTLNEAECLNFKIK